MYGSWVRVPAGSQKRLEGRFFFMLGWDPVSAVSVSRSGINLPKADNTLIYDNSCGTTELVFQKNLDIESILNPFKFDEIRKSK